jgi:glyoxylase-like metal-dependent hydrolase (beta-lactamase superfamily II)
MILEQIPVGGDRNFAYVVGCEIESVGAIFDPSFAPERVVEAARRHGLAVRYIVNTHGHDDHTNGNDSARALTGAKVVAHADSGAWPDVAVGDGDSLPLGSLTMTFIHTPGHTPDSMSILIGDALITGDTLFVGKVGGTGIEADARQEYDSLHAKLMTLRDEVRVYPGHDYGVRPSSTIAEERRTNPFLLQPDFAAFLELKRTWAEYKRRHGIK